MRTITQCYLQSHLPVRDTTHTLSDSGYMHLIIGNVTGEHLQRCHNLITVCKYDTAVGGILNTNAEDNFSRHICTLNDSVVPVGEIEVSTTICFYIILRGYFTQEMWATWGRGPQFRAFYLYDMVINITVVVLVSYQARDVPQPKYGGNKITKRCFRWLRLIKKWLLLVLKYHL